MTHRMTTLVLAVVLGTAASAAMAQSNDPAAERARLANQRIAAEAARRTGIDEAPDALTASPADTGDKAEAGDGAMGGEVPEIAAPAENPPLKASDAQNARVPPGPAPAASLTVAAADPPAADVANGGLTYEESGSNRAADSELSVEQQATGGQGISSMLEELERLGQLRDAGYVTDEEFEQIKRRILDGRL